MEKELFEINVKGIVKVQTTNNKVINIVKGDVVEKVKEIEDCYMVKFLFDTQMENYGNFLVPKIDLIRY